MLIETQFLPEVSLDAGSIHAWRKNRIQHLICKFEGTVTIQFSRDCLLCFVCVSYPQKLRLDNRTSETIYPPLLRNT
jgi:hypothetical protein